MRLAVIVVAVASLACGGLAVAATQTDATDRPRAAAQLKRGFLAVAADYLGLSRRQLVAELRSGRSLAQIATARGKSVDGLKQALLGAFKTRVDAAVAAGRLDSARAARILQRVPAHVDRLVNATRTTRAGRPPAGAKGLLAVAARYLGLPRREVVAQLRGGQSLAQIAIARGKSAEELEAALLAAFRARVEARVAAGRLDSARAQRILERAPERIHRLVTRTRA
jgi:lambda repressor-like predicted transcriptional regulator